MGFDAWTFALQAANFLVLVWLLHRFLYRPLLRVMAERKAAAEKLVAEVKAEKASADALSADLERRRAKIEDERDGILQAAREAAETERAAILTKAHEEAAAADATARKTFERERSEAAQSLGRDAAKLAVSIVRRLLREAPAASAADPRLGLILDDVRALPAETRGRIAERLASLDQAPQVVTAAPLDAATQRRLSADLSAALGAKLAPAFQVEPALLAGIEIHFPYTILRRSWSEDLKRIEAELAHDDSIQKRA